MKQILLTEHDSFVIKGNKIHLIVTEENGLQLDKMGIPSYLAEPSIKYINGEDAINDIKWTISDNLAEKGFVLLNTSTEGLYLKMIYYNLANGIVRLKNGETLLVGEIIEPIRLIGVQPHHAEAYRKLGR